MKVRWIGIAGWFERRRDGWIGEGKINSVWIGGGEEERKGWIREGKVKELGGVERRKGKGG